MKQSNPHSQNSKKHSGKREKRPPKKITERYLHNAGLHYLQKFAVSSGHFRKVMSRKIDRSCQWHEDQDKDACLALLDKLIAKYEDLGLLDDKAYAAAMVASLRRRGTSKRMIFSKLRQKSVSPEMIDEAIQYYRESYTENDEITAGVSFIRRKRIGAYAAPDKIDEKSREKWLAMLARNGYSYDIAKTVLALDYEEAEGILSPIL